MKHFTHWTQKSRS